MGWVERWKVEGGAAAYQAQLRAGALSAGSALDDSAAFHFIGDRLAQVVASRPAARAFQVRRVDGAVVESPLETRYLGSA